MPASFTSRIERLPSTVPFVGPETAERNRGAPFLARIGANESVFGPSPKAVRAMQAAAADAWKYGDPENHELRNALAGRLGVRAENIMVGEGIDGLLGVAVRLYVEPGVKVVTSEGAYPTFNFHVAGFGGELVKVPFREDREDAMGLVAAAREQGAKVVYLSNPDNPMGTWWEGAQIEAMIAAMPKDATLFLDEAYMEFAPEGTAPPFDVSNPGVIRFRTFSKAHGMAGARIGYAIGEEATIAAFNKVRNHFGVSRIAQAGALAAIDDTEWLASVQGRVAEGRERIYQIARQNGLAALPSATNFVAVDCGRDAAFAKAVLDGLVARGIFVRMPFAAPGNRCIRVGVGLPQDLGLFAEILPQVLETAHETASA